MNRHHLSIAAVLVLAACACSKSEAPSSKATPAPPSSTPASAPPQGQVSDASSPGTSGADARALGESADTGVPAATIVGTVFFDGPAPARKPIAVSSLPGCHHEGELLTEQYIVENGRLANAFVSLKQFPSELAVPPPPAEAVLLDQRGCQYVPHVVGVRVGQTLRVKNSDQTNHNVKVDPRNARNAEKNGMNKIQPPLAPDFELVFEQPEALIPFGCTLHPHMNAHVGVVAHPYFAISDAKGRFELKNLVPGRYTLEIVHEQAGRKSLELELGSSFGRAVEVRFGKR